MNRSLLRASLCACVWLTSACATTGQTAQSEPAIDPIAEIDRDAELAQLRRENDRLRSELRKVRMLGSAADSASNGDQGARPAHRSSFPTHLPVVKVSPDNPTPTPSPADTTAPSAHLASAPEAPAPRGVTLGEVPHSGVDEPGIQSQVFAEQDHLPALPPEPEDSTASYHLVGSQLVRASKRERPEPTTAKPENKKKIEMRGKKSSSKSKRSRGDDVLAAYKAAMNLYKSGEMVAAEHAFAQIVRQHSSHEYADNALYWQGEAAYDQRRYDDALAAFTGVIERYGGGNKAPDALLKIGLCYGKLGDVANSRDVLTQLVSAYPSARASAIAKSRLAELPES